MVQFKILLVVQLAVLLKTSALEPESNVSKGNMSVKEVSLAMSGFKCRAIVIILKDGSMNTTEDIMKLANMAKLENCDEIKDEFPLSIRNLVWDQVCLKSIAYNEFLMSEFDTTHKLVTTKNENISDFKGKWRFEDVDIKNSTFKLRNTLSNEYIFSEDVELTLEKEVYRRIIL